MANMSDPFADPFADPSASGRLPASGSTGLPGREEEEREHPQRSGREMQPAHTWRRGERPAEVRVCTEKGGRASHAATTCQQRECSRLPVLQKQVVLSRSQLVIRALSR